ncbi:MAG TPA: flagellar biosynthesis anti-sigma factor FlgM [Bryobacteraceae bacterium]
MRIEDNTTTNLYKSNGPGSIPEVDVQTRPSAAHPGEAAGSDSAHLSNAVHWVAFARQASSPERQARVSGVIAQVQSGQYSVDPPEVSRSVVQGHLSG